MAIRFNADFQAVYLHEPLGHTVPALNTPWSVAGLYRREELAPAGRRNTLIVALYGTTTAGSWVGLYMNDDGTSCRLEGWRGTPESIVTSSSSYALEQLREYMLAIDYNGAGTVRLLVDGVPALTMAFTPVAGTLGERSLQWGGYGELDDYTDSTIARWRMWTRLLTEAEHRAEHRSTVPVRTDGLIHNWPMVAGSGRLADTVSGEPDLAENPMVPVGDGADFLLRPSLYGAPLFFPLGDLASPPAQTINVPQFAKAVAIHVFATDDTVPDVEVLSVSSNFTGAFALDATAPNPTSAAGAIATALVESYGPGRSFTVTMAAANSLAGAAAWVSFIQDVPDAFLTDTTHGEAIGDASTPGVASAAGTAGGLAIASDTRLDAGSGNYPPNQADWRSLGTGQSGPGAYGYYGPSRLREKPITATGAQTATTQSTFASIVSLLTLEPAPALATVAPTAPVVEVGDVTNSGNNTASTSWGVACPALALGDMLLVHLGWDDSTDVASVTPVAGPNGETATLVAGPVASSGTEVRAAVWRYIALGTWSAANRNFSPAASEQWTGSVLKVPAGEFDATTPTGAASTRSSAGTAESSVLSPAYSLGAGDGGGRLISWLVVDDDPIDAQATGWTPLANVDRGVVAGCLAARDQQTSNSEAVPAGIWRIASDSWCSLAYVIRKPSSGSSVALGAAAAAQSSATAALNLAKALAAAAAGQATGAAGMAVLKPLGATGTAAAGAVAGLQVTSPPVLLAAGGAAAAAATAALLKGVSLSAAGVAVVSAGASVSHTVPLHADAAAVAVAGAQMALAVTLSAVGVGAAAASAGVAVDKRLAAAGAAQAGAAATLVTNSSTDLVASGGAVAGGTAVLSLLVTLSGAAVAQAQAAAGMAVEKRLGAAGSAQASGSSTLATSSSTELAAHGGAQAAGGASLWLDIPLTAAALSQALAGASLTLSVPLNASAIAHASASARLEGLISLSAGGGAEAAAAASLQVMGPVFEIARGMVARNERRDWTAKNQPRSWRATS